ncbi:MAG: positive regulation of histone deubiquitination [Marteilia pararefringens]
MSIKNINEANNLLKYITTHESIDRDQVLMLCFHLLDQVNDNDSLSQFIALYILKFAVQNYNAFQYKLIPYLALKFTNDSACTNHLYWKIFMMINSNQMTEGIILDTLNEAAELCSTDVKNCGEFCINLITHLCNHIDIKSKEKIEDDSFLSQYIDLITKTVEYFVQRLQQFNRCSQYLSRLYIVSLNYLTKWKQINISRTFWGRLLDISESVSDVMLFDYVKFEEAFGDEDQICDSIVYSIDRCTDIMNKKYLLHIFEAKYLMNDPERSKDFRSLHNAFKKCRGKQNDNSKDKKNYETNRESIQPNNPVNSNDFTLFISNLDYLITREEIAEFFKVNAGIEQCEIELKGMKNKIKKHSGFGNVNFLSKSDCEKALALNRLLIGTKQRPIYISKFNQKFQVNKYSEQEESNKVFLQNLPMFITEEELSSHLGTIDSPNSIRIARTRSGKGK